MYANFNFRSKEENKFVKDHLKLIHVQFGVLQIVSFITVKSESRLLDQSYFILIFSWVVIKYLNKMFVMSTNQILFMVLTAMLIFGSAPKSQFSYSSTENTFLQRVFTFVQVVSEMLTWDIDKSLKTIEEIKG